jgi:hypothetical protein
MVQFETNQGRRVKDVAEDFGLESLVGGLCRTPHFYSIMPGWSQNYLLVCYVKLILMYFQESSFNTITGKT